MICLCLVSHWGWLQRAVDAPFQFPSESCDARVRRRPCSSQIPHWQLAQRAMPSLCQCNRARGSKDHRNRRLASPQTWTSCDTGDPGLRLHAGPRMRWASAPPQLLELPLPGSHGPETGDQTALRCPHPRAGQPAARARRSSWSFNSMRYFLKESSQVVQEKWSILYTIARKSP